MEYYLQPNSGGTITASTQLVCVPPYRGQTMSFRALTDEPDNTFDATGISYISHPYTTLLFCVSHFQMFQLETSRAHHTSSSRQQHNASHDQHDQ